MYERVYIELCVLVYTYEMQVGMGVFSVWSEMGDKMMNRHREHPTHNSINTHIYNNSNGGGSSSSSSSSTDTRTTASHLMANELTN